jgi:hypothetical protein
MSGSSEAMAPRSQSERAAERRRQKLERVQEQLRNGSLTVRQMNPKSARAGVAARLVGRLGAELDGGQGPLSGRAAGGG